MIKIEVQGATYRCDKEIFNYNERSLDEFAYLRSERPHVQSGLNTPAPTPEKWGKKDGLAQYPQQLTQCWAKLRAEGVKRWQSEYAFQLKRIETVQKYSDGFVSVKLIQKCILNYLHYNPSLNSTLMCYTAHRRRYSYKKKTKRSKKTECRCIVSND